MVVVGLDEIKFEDGEEESLFVVVVGVKGVLTPAVMISDWEL